MSGLSRLLQTIFSEPKHLNRKVYKGSLPCISMVKQIVIRVDDDLFKKAVKKKEHHSDTWEDVVKFYLVMRGGE